MATIQNLFQSGDLFKTNTKFCGVFNAKTTDCTVFKQEKKTDRNGKEYMATSLRVNIKTDEKDKCMFFNFPYDLWDGNSLLNQFRFATGLSSNEEMTDAEKKKLAAKLSETSTYENKPIKIIIAPKFSKDNTPRTYKGKDGNDVISLDVVQIYSHDTPDGDFDEWALKQYSFAKEMLKEKSKRDSYVGFEKEVDPLGGLPF